MPSNTRSRSPRPAASRGTTRGASSKQDTAKKRSSPTEKMLDYASRIADALDMDLPEDVETSFDACRAFIDEYAVQVPPTDKQVDFAHSLAEGLGEDIPEDILDSKIRLSEWIDAHSE